MQIALAHMITLARQSFSGSKISVVVIHYEALFTFRNINETCSGGEVSKMETFSVRTVQVQEKRKFDREMSLANFFRIGIVQGSRR